MLSGHCGPSADEGEEAPVTQQLSFQQGQRVGGQTGGRGQGGQLPAAAQRAATAQMQPHQD